MQIVGRLIFKQLVLIQSQDVNFYKITVVVEMGNKAEHRKLSVFSEEIMSLVANMELDTPVRVDTYMSNSGYETVSALLLLEEIQSCVKCFQFSIYGVTDAQPPPCEGCLHQLTHERIDGIWIAKSVLAYLSPAQQDKKDYTATRVVLQQEDNLLGFVSFPKTPYYDVISTLMIGDEIRLIGWRDSKRRFTVVSLHGADKK